MTTAAAMKPRDEPVLPLDIIELILLKSPVRSLAKFKSVCKLWQAIISNPRFLETIHIQRHKLQNRFLVSGPSRSFSLLKFENGRLLLESVLGTPFGHASSLCSCHNLVLLRRYTLSDEYVLWNPSYGMYTKISMICGYGFYPDSYGIFHDSTTDDYNVVVIASFQLHYAVFSCKSRSWGAGWRPFPSLGFRDVDIRLKKGVVFDGSIYWWNYDDEKIACFDVRDYKMKELMQLPGQRKVNPLHGDKLIVLSGLLCLWRRILESGGYSDGRLQLWVMERDGEEGYYYWREVMNVKLKVFDQLEDTPIYLTNEDEVVFATKSASIFFAYKYSEKGFEVSWKFSCFEDRRIDFCSRYGDVMIPCSESPFFPS